MHESQSAICTASAISIHLLGSSCKLWIPKLVYKEENAPAGISAIEIYINSIVYILTHYRRDGEPLA